MCPASRAFLVAPALGLIWLGVAVSARAQETQALRPGLSAAQTRQAVELARGAMDELRSKGDAADRAAGDRREYVVGVELLSASPPPAAARAAPTTGPGTDATRKDAPAPMPPAKPGRTAVVTLYRYRDDLTVFMTIDLAAGRVVEVQAVRHLRTALSDEEFEDAKALARERSVPVQELFERFGGQITAYPQFSQFTVKGDPRVHRVVHLTYRVGARDLSYPRPVVDLTTRQVETPGPEVFPQPRRR